jgi:hypothetical protein
MDQLLEMAAIFSKIDLLSLIGTLAQTSYSSFGMAAGSKINDLCLTITFCHFQT